MPAYAESDSNDMSHIKKLIVLIVGAPIALAVGIGVATAMSSQILSARATELSVNVVAKQNQRVDQLVKFYTSHKTLYQSIQKPDFNGSSQVFKQAVSSSYGDYASAAKSVCEGSVTISKDALRPMSKLQITDRTSYDLYSSLSSSTLPIQTAYGCADSNARLIYDKWNFQFVVAAFSLIQMTQAQNVTAQAAALKEIKATITANSVSAGDYEKIDRTYGESISSFMKDMPLTMEFTAESMSGNANAVNDPKYAKLLQKYESGDSVDTDEIAKQLTSANVKIQKGLVDDSYERFKSISALNNKQPIKEFDKNSWLLEILPAALSQYAQMNDQKLPEASSIEQVTKILKDAGIIQKDLSFPGFTFNGTPSEYSITTKIKDKTITLSDTYGHAESDNSEAADTRSPQRQALIL
ncbi:MAG: hypothetical protein EOO17_01865 [Chloroflexi bacterium]|nr:MAG: hypothetical protein EOO17_01865 [Chloroflexota bacterium]